MEFDGDGFFHIAAAKDDGEGCAVAGGGEVPELWHGVIGGGFAVEGQEDVAIAESGGERGRSGIDRLGDELAVLADGVDAGHVGFARMIELVAGGEVEPVVGEIQRGPVAFEKFQAERRCAFGFIADEAMVMQASHIELRDTHLPERLRAVEGERGAGDDRQVRRFLHAVKQIGGEADRDVLPGVDFDAVRASRNLQMDGRAIERIGPHCNGMTPARFDLARPV